MFRPKKKNCYVALTRPKFENWVGRSNFFFFFFFFFTYRERVEFSNIFLQVSKWGKLGRNAVKTHILYKCFFKPLNTNFSKFFAQIWHKKKINKKNLTLFFRILRSVGRGQHKHFFFLALWSHQINQSLSNKGNLSYTWLILITTATASWSIKLNLPTDVGALNLIIYFKEKNPEVINL